MIEKPQGIAIACYSRSGHSRRLAENLRQHLHATIFEIRAPAYPRGVLGYLRAGHDSLRHQRSLPPQSFKSLAGFDHLILCGPVWTSYPSVPLRALMGSAIALPRDVSLFLTTGDHSPAQKAFGAAQEYLGRPFCVTASLPNSDEGTALETHLIDQFVTDVRNAAVKAARN